MRDGVQSNFVARMKRLRVDAEAETNGRDLSVRGKRVYDTKS